jgi:hypothetical protein
LAFNSVESYIIRVKNVMMRRRILPALMVAIVAITAVWYFRQLSRSPEQRPAAVSTPPPAPAAPVPAAPAALAVQAAASTPAREAELVLKALHSRNMAELAAHVHPVKGLRFSPYIHIDPKRSVVLQASELPKALDDPKPRRWGSEDGTGDPIVRSFANYFARFVYDRDFLSASERRVNEFGGKSTTTPNVREIYPDATVIEAHVPGAKPEYAGLDWASLLLVFEQYESRWYLVALVHDQWTI